MRRNTLLRLGGNLISALAPTCTHVPAAAGPRPAVPDARPPTHGYYDAPGEVPQPLSRAIIHRGSGYRVERVLLPARLSGTLDAIPLAEDPIELLHYHPEPSSETPRPLLLMSPILGNSVLLVGSFARGFAQRGYHAVIVQRKELAFDPRASLRQAEDEVRLVVMRSRQALDFLVRRQDVDATRLGTFGVSAGGIVSSMVAGADPRLKAHVWMLAGGPLTDVMVDTVEDRFRGYVREALHTSPRSRDQLRREVRARIRTDPLLLAPHVDRERVMLVLARFDRSVPYRYGLALWRALGRPERIVCPFGHYSSLVLLPWLRRKTFEYFERHFE